MMDQPSDISDLFLNPWISFVFIHSQSESKSITNKVRLKRSSIECLIHSLARNWNGTNLHKRQKETWIWKLQSDGCTLTKQLRIPTLEFIGIFVSSVGVFHTNVSSFRAKSVFLFRWNVIVRVCSRAGNKSARLSQARTNTTSGFTIAHVFVAVKRGKTVNTDQNRVETISISLLQCGVCSDDTRSRDILHASINARSRRGGCGYFFLLHRRLFRYLLWFCFPNMDFSDARDFFTRSRRFFIFFCLEDCAIELWRDSMECKGF